MSITVSPVMPSIISNRSMNTASFFTSSPTPSASRADQALGAGWMPAPISPNACACSSTTLRKPLSASPSAQASPPMPPPATITGFALRATLTLRSIVERQADVVFGERLLRSARAEQVGQFRRLNPAAERVGFRKAFKKRGNHPGEPQADQNPPRDFLELDLEHEEAPSLEVAT